jgi:hypothetical protein
MNAVELHMPDGKPARVWMCQKCKTLVTRQYQPIGDGNGHTFTPDERDAFAKQSAERCCTEKPCERCGKGLGKTWNHGGYTICEACRQVREQEREQGRFEKATKVSLNEWDGECWLYDGSAERWFRDLEDFYDYYAEQDEDEKSERPVYLWLSNPVRWSPDPRGDIADQMHDRFHEDADEQITKADWKKLEYFVEAWWQEHRPQSWDVDYSRCLLLEAREVQA